MRMQVKEMIYGLSKNGFEIIDIKLRSYIEVDNPYEEESIIRALVQNNIISQSVVSKLDSTFKNRRNTVSWYIYCEEFLVFNIQ